MIYEALLVPHESPNTLREIKRALLTYDKLIIIDPSDRDMMPSNALFSTILGLPAIGIDTGPIRPMGKTPDYDDQFTKILDLCKQATKQGLIDVKSTYKPSKNLTIGAVLTGGYPLDTRFVFSLYRTMAADQAFLRSAVADGIAPVLRELPAAPDLALEGTGDWSINQIPALPLLQGDVEEEKTVIQLTQIARARLGAFIKYCGYCEAKNLVPILPSAIYGGILSCLLNNTREALAEDDEDRFWGKRNRVLELCHEEFLIENKLDEISIEDVLLLRTRAWGQQAEAREKLFESVFEIANEFDSDPDFEERARSQIREYHKSSEELISQRRKLGFQIKCDLGIASLTGGSVIIGLLSQLEAPACIASTLLMGSLVLKTIKDYVPALRGLREKERQMKRGAGFGLHNFYSRIT